MGGKETLLLVDDEETVIDVDQQMLSRVGYTILTAKSGEEALERYRAEKETIKLVLLDLNMPGMGGYRCLEELKKLDPQLPVIISSGYSLPTLSGDLFRSGARAFLPKPHKFKDMSNTIRQVLDSYPES